MNPMGWLALELSARPWLPRFSGLIVGTDKALQHVTRARVAYVERMGREVPVLWLTPR
jgi:hypothetical protein